MTLHQVYSMVEQHLIALAVGRAPVREICIWRLGIPVGVLRDLKDRLWTSHDEDHRWEVWSYIWHLSPYVEMKSLALYHYQHRGLSDKQITGILGWVDGCCCWQHSDELTKIYASLVEKHPEKLYPVLEAWNHSFNPWKRRQSVVSLLEYARLRQRYLPFEKMIALVHPVLQDPDYYVQRGVGWTLREIHAAYPEKALSYIEEHLHRIPAHVYSTATEKLPESLRSEWRKRRKAQRQRRGRRAPSS